MVGIIYLEGLLNWVVKPKVKVVKLKAIPLILTYRSVLEEGTFPYDLET